MLQKIKLRLVGYLYKKFDFKRKQNVGSDWFGYVQFDMFSIKQTMKKNFYNMSSDTLFVCLFWID